MSDSFFVPPSVSCVEHCVPKHDFTTYAVITDPPSNVGAPQETSTPPVLSGFDFTSVGTPGKVRGVTATEGSESSPGPAVFTAATLKKYSTPFVRPLTTAGLSAMVLSSNVRYLPSTAVEYFTS